MCWKVLPWISSYELSRLPEKRLKEMESFPLQIVLCELKGLDNFFRMEDSSWVLCFRILNIKPSRSVASSFAIGPRCQQTNPSAFRIAPTGCDRTRLWLNFSVHVHMWELMGRGSVNAYTKTIVLSMTEEVWHPLLTSPYLKTSLWPLKIIHPTSTMS